MHIKPITNLTTQLQSVIPELTSEQYTIPIKILSQSSIGKHIRHVIEFFTELGKGYETGSINYDKRDRNLRIEADKNFGVKELENLARLLQKPDKPLLLLIRNDQDSTVENAVQTNYFRELIYTYEHMLHHMALIKIGVQAVSDLEMPDQFGVSVSTLQYRKACVQ